MPFFIFQQSSLVGSASHCPSVLWHCLLGHVTCKIMPKMTCIMLSRTLNPAILYYTTLAVRNFRSAYFYVWQLSMHISYSISVRLSHSIIALSFFVRLLVYIVILMWINLFTKQHLCSIWVSDMIDGINDKSLILLDPVLGHCSTTCFTLLRKHQQESAWKWLRE